MENQKVTDLGLKHPPKMSLHHSKLAGLGPSPAHIVCDGLATVAMGMCGHVQALKAERPASEEGLS